MTNKRPDPFTLWLHLKFNFLYNIFFLSRTMMVVNKIHHNKAGKENKDEQRLHCSVERCTFYRRQR